MVITFPCSICTKAIGGNDNSIYCDKCNLWFHIKCNNLNFIDYQYLNGNDDPWFCLKCNSEIYPFGTLSLVLKPPPNFTSLFNQFNNSS